MVSLHFSENRMFEIKQKPKQAERALLVSVYKGAAQKEESESLLVELNSLVDTLGIPVLIVFS